MPRVAISIGSNVGDRTAHLTFAVDRLRNLLDDLRVSSFVQTTPVGVAQQPDFLNGAITGEASLSARALLDRLLAIEAERGRLRPYAGAPRTLDLDLILYGSDVIEEPAIQVPHPRFRDREFVLQPLTEIAPDWVDPVSGRTIAELLRSLRSRTQEPDRRL